MLKTIDIRLKFAFLLSFSGALYVQDYYILVAEILILFFLYYNTKSNHSIYNIVFKLTTYLSLLAYIIIIILNYINSVQILTKTESIIKILIVSYSSIIFFATTSFSDLFLLLKFFRVNKSLSEAFFSAFRFFPIVLYELSNIVLAQKSKGLNVNKGIRTLKTLPKTIQFSLVPLLNSIIHKLELMYITREYREIDINKGFEALSFKLSFSNVICIISTIALLSLPFIF